MSDAAAFDRWVVAMKQGNYEAAWQETDRLEEVERLAGRTHLLWNGCPFDGRLVGVRCLHGLGDTLQFSRFLPRLRAVAADCWIVPPTPLRALFRQQPEFGHICARLPPLVLEAGIEIEIMELAYAFRATPASLPLPCLRTTSVARSSAHVSTPVQIAIFWSASGWGGGRYLPLRTFDSLAGVAGCEFLSFQQGECAREVNHSALAIRHLASQTGTLLDLAERLETVDLIITVDTMAAHLAGSLRRPVWLLLEQDANWRWIEHRSNSPWYPEMRIFRETASGWGSALDEMRNELQRFATIGGSR